MYTNIHIPTHRYIDFSNMDLNIFINKLDSFSIGTILVVDIIVRVQMVQKEVAIRHPILVYVD